MRSIGAIVDDGPIALRGFTAGVRRAYSGKDAAMRLST